MSHTIQRLDNTTAAIERGHQASTDHTLASQLRIMREYWLGRCHDIHNANPGCDAAFDAACQAQFFREAVEASQLTPTPNPSV